ncbi:intraflagellar transport protein 27 homolog isoform X2 [Thalassophryne amazonica]|uniref:intraflagellar transport protein 27 homolog isoform X2 n=1 Tax=Thalassophryne amazonica TaxID=390379 RepID=UPI001471CD5C|nr:intraflagellar transport protein 27 homolog isoform X2 [Thalassophryne amazonica]
MVKLRARCLLVGDAAVGKSTLCHMFHSDGSLFQNNYSMTTGIELLVKCVNIPETNDSVELYIIDSAGKETFVEACEKMSFSNCSCWMERVHAHCQDHHIPGVLVGNKSDLSARREVQTSVAQEWAQSQGLEYYETSAKEMENYDAPLLSLARTFQSLYHQSIETIQNLTPG